MSRSLRGVVQAKGLALQRDFLAKYRSLVTIQVYMVEIFVALKEPFYTSGGPKKSQSMYPGVT